MNALDYAVGYAKRGLFVLALRPGRKEPATRHGLHDATDLWQSVDYLWRHEYRECNVGIRTGDGLVVIDLDVHDGVCVGEDSLREIEASLGGLPLTVTADTPSGGVHLYYRVDRFVRCSVGRIAPGIDIRGDGGYVVAPPSTCEEGGWIWRRNGAREMAPLPQVYVDLLTAEPGEEERRDVGSVTDYDAYVNAALHGEAERVASSCEGYRNATLNRCAFALGTLVGAGRLSRSDAEAVLYPAAREAGLKPSEIEKTMRSGLDAGEKRPR